ncbi:MAG TPA: hypothetical protein VLJ16_11195 [Acidobacteriota bacterium]|nr:hypothetical protein [Acidobacteriota bacterium]
MGFTRAFARALRAASAAAALAGLVGACAGRPPVLIPPSSPVESVEGFASASVTGTEASVKGKFAFLFRRPGLGRIEALDPIGRTAFLIYFRGGRAWFVLPSKKAYAEDDAEAMMRRFLGVALRPDDTISLLSGVWPEDAGGGGWTVGRDAEGRVVGGAREEVRFEVGAFFRGDAVPRVIEVAGAGTTGRVKILRAAFNPPPRDEAFDTAFLSRFTAKTWDELAELLDR